MEIMFRAIFFLWAEATVTITLALSDQSLYLPMIQGAHTIERVRPTARLESAEGIQTKMIIFLRDYGKVA